MGEIPYLLDGQGLTLSHTNAQSSYYKQTQGQNWFELWFWAPEPKFIPRIWDAVLGTTNLRARSLVEIRLWGACHCVSIACHWVPRGVSNGDPFSTKGWCFGTPFTICDPFSNVWGGFRSCSKRVISVSFWAPVWNTTTNLTWPNIWGSSVIRAPLLRSGHWWLLRRRCSC